MAREGLFRFWPDSGLPLDRLREMGGESRVMSATWGSRVSSDCRRVLFTGPEGRLTAKVVVGSLSGETLKAVMSLSIPSQSRYVVRGGKVLEPDSRHADVQLVGPLQRVTLRILGGREVPATLVRDLRDVFELKREPGLLNAELSRRGSDLGKRSGAARRAKRNRWLGDEDSETSATGGVLGSVPAPQGAADQEVA